jgi:hypothetical protein
VHRATGFVVTALDAAAPDDFFVDRPAVDVGDVLAGTLCRDVAADDEDRVAVPSADALPPLPPRALAVRTTNTINSTTDATSTRRRRQYTDGG